MKLAAGIARSLQADLQAELRDIGRAVAAGTRELPYGLRVTVRPLTTAGMAAAQAAARRVVEAIERQARERTEAGLTLDGLPDLSTEGERDGFYQAQLIRELAVRHIASWSGVEREGGTAPPTPDNIAAVVELYRSASAFSRSSRFVRCCSTRQKTDPGPLPLAFQPGGGPEYCRACREDGLPCARGGPGADGRLCPYREHALISRQEHEAWDVLLACQGQLRLAPSGQVIGIDMQAALQLAGARSDGLSVLSELLPAAEAGVVEALCQRGAT